jgi:hypothetical protein
MAFGTGEAPAQDLSLLLDDVAEKWINTLFSDVIAGTFKVFGIDYKNFIPEVSENCRPKEHLFPGPDPIFIGFDLVRIKDDLGIQFFKGIQIPLGFIFLGVNGIGLVDHMFG